MEGKYEIMKKSNKDSITDADSSFESADIVVGFSRQGGITPEWIRKMNSNPIVFANANPNPEISPEEAYKAGAYIVSTGRSDYPNQINNSLIFPALFRGVLDSKAKKIDDYTAIAAAEELAKFAQEKGLGKDYIVPNMEEREIYPRIAAAVAEDAVKRGLSDMKEGREYFYKKAKKVIGLK